MNAIPHELARLLLDLGSGGIELAPHPTDANRLRHRPVELPPEVLAGLRTHRGAILRLLAGEYAPGPDADFIFTERLAMAEGLGMPTCPGSAAWLTAIGESLGI